MSNEVSDNVAVIDPENGEDSQEVANSFKALKLSSPTALSSTPSCVSPSIKPLDSGERVPDSGYGSNSSTPDRIKHTPILLRKPGQTPLIRQTGLCVSNKTVQAVTKRRFLEVQLEIEKMLLELIRKTKPGPERYKPIAIRLMMLGKTETDADANSYMVVICSENIKRKVQDFFEEPLVKALCEPDDDDVPSFKALVIGHALRLRVATSNISVQCGAMNSFYDGTKTFCGMPIRLFDEFGHSRNATFGGMVKLTSTKGGYQLYGLTAGHLIRDSHVVKDEDETGLADINGNNLLDLYLTEQSMEGSNDQIRTPPPKTTNDRDWDDSDNWCFRHEHHLGKVIDVNAPKNLMNGEESQMKPCLDWALFELTAHRPNQLAFHGREHSRGDLHLPLSTLDPSNDEIPVSMLCASQGVKHGVLSTTCARVLLDPGETFTDAYTLSLEGSEVSDGDSGSWVVDELRLEVYGHVVADDVFGNAYVIPMNDILADIQRCLGAESVDLPSGLDIISTATLQQTNLFVGLPGDRQHSQSTEGELKDVSCISNAWEGLSMPDAALNDDASIISADFVRGPSRSSCSVDVPTRPASAPPSAAVNLDQEQMMRPLATNPVYTDELIYDFQPCVGPDSGYSSLNVTPARSPQNRRLGRTLERRMRDAFEAADRRGCGQLTEDQVTEAFESLFDQSFSVRIVRSLGHLLPERQDALFDFDEFSNLSELLESQRILFHHSSTKDSSAALGGTQNHMDVEQFSSALVGCGYIKLSPEFVKTLYHSSTRKRRTVMDLEDYLGAFIKLKRMTDVLSENGADWDGHIEISFERGLDMMLKLMD